MILKIPLNWPKRKKTNMAHSMICAHCAIPMVFTENGPDHTFENRVRSCAELFRCPGCNARVLRADADDAIIEDHPKAGDFLVRDKPLPDSRREQARSERKERISKTSSAISEELELALTENSFGFIMDLAQMFRNIVSSGIASAPKKMMTMRGTGISKWLDEILKEDA